MVKINSYLVFSRKYRPTVFDDVVGQGHVVRTLSNAVLNSKVGHSYLFSGPRGVGKTTVARIFARALNCEERSGYNPCNQCINCVSILEGNSVDVVEIDGASNNGVDEIRRLRENITLAPMYGKYRIFIIDEVHMLSKGAFNALLKTLEEPPHHVVFIFATTEPHQLPSTVISRCQHFVFRSIPSSVTYEVLKKICEKEGIKSDDDSLKAIARLSEGSLRDAESILDQIVSFTGGKVAKEEIDKIFNLVDRHLIRELVSAFVFRDTPKALEVINAITAAGYEIKEVCNELIMCFRYILIVQYVQEGLSKFEINEDDVLFYQEMGSSLSVQEIQWILDELCGIQEEVKGFFYPVLLLEQVAVKITQRIGIMDFEDVYNRLGVIYNFFRNQGDLGNRSSVGDAEVSALGGVCKLDFDNGNHEARLGFQEKESICQTNLSADSELTEHKMVKRALEIFSGRIVYPPVRGNGEN